MNKKAYIAPTMEALNIETEVMIAASENVFSIFDETTDANATMSNEHRGTWGNLWK